MANYGRIQAVVIATLTGNVVYERFYENFTDLEKSDLRSALQQVNRAQYYAPLLQRAAVIHTHGAGRIGRAHPCGCIAHPVT